MKHGVIGTEIEWFKSYICGRKEFCAVNGQSSSIGKVICGIPQGSCLGPLLFIVYLSDFENCYTHRTIASSDGTEPISMTKRVLRVLLNISDWFRVNKLRVNPQKT